MVPTTTPNKTITPTSAITGLWTVMNSVATDASTMKNAQAISGPRTRLRRDTGRATKAATAPIGNSTRPACSGDSPRAASIHCVIP